MRRRVIPPAPYGTWSPNGRRRAGRQPRALLRAADRHDGTVVLARTVGDLVTRGTVLADLYGIPPPPMDRLRGQFAFGRERRTVSAGSTTMSGEHEVTDHDHVVMPVRLRHKVDDPGVSAAAVGGDRRCCSSG
jgi:hypothetical protein